MESNPSKDQDKLSKRSLALKEEAQKIAGILGEAQESLKIMEYLAKGDPAIDVYNKHADSFWGFTAWVFANQVLLGLHILLHKEEHYSIPKLLNKLKPGGLFKSIISTEQINKWEARIEEMKASYDRIAVRRNKQIAHRDRSFDETQAEHIKIQELRDIVALVQEIIKEIYAVTEQSHYLIEHPVNAPIEGLKK